MAFLAMTAVTPCPAMTAISVKAARIPTARNVFPPAGTVKTFIVLAVWQTVGSVVIQFVLRA